MADPKFSITNRDGKSALWVEWGDGEYNIWDLKQEEATPNVLAAIRSAFRRGVECQYARHLKVEAVYVPILDDRWELVLKKKSTPIKKKRRA